MPFVAPLPLSSVYLSRRFAGASIVVERPKKSRLKPTSTGIRAVAVPPTGARSYPESELQQNASEERPDDVNAWVGLKHVVPYEALRTVSKAGQYLGNEFGAVRKPWNSVEVRFCLAYPDLYSIGMSSTGHVVLYSCINDDPILLCDRSYLPAPDMQAVLEKYGRPLFAVESKRALSDFDIIGMSLMYELGATNCVKVMQLAGIPYTWWDRDSAATTLRGGPPLIFAGGLTVTANPEPYCDLFDFMSIGDGEEMLPEIGRCVARALKENSACSREEVLLRLAQEVSGVYVPRFYQICGDGAVRRTRDDVPERIQKRNSLPQPWRASSLVPISDPIHDRLTVEVRRGCTRGCRFCLPGMVQRPARDVPPETVIETVKQGVKSTGYNEFSLLSLSCSDWLSLPSVGLQLKNELKKENQSISLSLGSQRVDRFDENIANVVGGLRKSGLTFAPEAGTQRMRDVINKGLTNEDLARGVKLAYDSGYQNVKLYFMINLPSETEEDVMGIADTIKWLQRICRARGRARLSLNVTVSTFTPKSWTPFQWHSSATNDIKRKQEMLKKALSSSRDVKLNMTDPMLSSMEDFIGRGDRRLGKAIIRAHELGAGMDGWWESMKEAYDAWCRAINEVGLEWHYRRAERGEWNIAETISEEIRGPRGWYDTAKRENLDRKNLIHRQGTGDHNQSPLDRPLPWDHIDTGLSKGWLRDELMRALTETLTPDCAFNDCSFCGVCGEDLGNNITIPPPAIPNYEGAYQPSTDCKQRVRVAFEKTGALALASHLDVNRMIDRVLRRARLPIAFSGGYHPLPRMVTAAALPFGSTASEELVDFYFREEVWVTEVIHKINKVLPEGMRGVWAREIPLRDPTVTQLMSSAEYILALEAVDSQPEWDKVINNVRCSGPVVVEKLNKRGKKRTRDLRKMLYDIRRATAEEAEPVLTHVGASNWPASGIVLKCVLELKNDGSLNPEGLVELLNLVMGTTDFQLIHVHRQRIILSEERD
eukprot:GFKZ01011686.1.p1 GENE.GFKZ01011686.1~~GFKZ01011686.1.p1  ORF type:complete len:994 (-),score=120.20 GFKZ01011686.1:747-3728(-)